MRAVHGRLRRALDIARDAIDSGSDTDTLASGPLIHCHGFLAALDGHHSSEDAGLFPQIAARRPDLAPVLAKLSQDHSMMAHLIGGLEKALTSCADRATLNGHLDGIGAIMESHFRYEERSLLTVLDDLPLALRRRDAFGAIVD
ncbi:MAG: hemerythrin domain-containing protein [Knoellia sp.]